MRQVNITITAAAIFLLCSNARSEVLIPEPVGPAIADETTLGPREVVISDQCKPLEKTPTEINKKAKEGTLVFEFDEKTGRIFIIKNLRECKEELSRQL